MVKIDENAFKKLNFKAQGVIGLGFETFEDPKYSKLRILDNIFSQENTKTFNKIFSFYLKPKIVDKKDKNPNQFTFGGYDPKLIQRGYILTYCQVKSLADWGISLDSISLEKNYNLTYIEKDSLFTTGGIVSIRSETSSIILQKPIWDEFLNGLNRKGLGCSRIDESNLIRCTKRSISDYPNIVFVLCGNKVVLNPIDYIEIKEGNAILYIQRYDGDKKGISCILGNIFMRKYYTVFDLFSHKIGFALATTDPIIDLSGFKLVYLFLIGLLILLTTML